MYKNQANIHNDHAFHFFDNFNSSFIELIAVGSDVINNSDYHWCNKERPEAMLFQYTLSGSGTVEIGGKKYIVDQGKAFFLKMPADESYYFDEESNSAPWKFVYIIFNGSAAEEFYKYSTERTGSIISLPEFHPAVRILMDLYGRALNSNIKNVFDASSALIQFLCALCSPCISQNSNLVDSAIDYFKRNFEKQITIAMAADYLGVSHSHLTREFLKYTKEKPSDYLTKLRMEKAVELLNSTNIKLKDISRQCGYSDENYFGKVFKKYIKISPAEFRAQSKTYGYTRH